MPQITTSDYYKVSTTYGPMPVEMASLSVISEYIDANLDGINDILLLGAYYPFNGTSPIGQPSLLLKGNADGTYSSANNLIQSTTGLLTIHPREVVKADFNEDGLTDLFIADTGYDASPFPGAQNHLLLSVKGGGFIDATANLPKISDYTHSTTTGDINSDGHQDIFVGNLNEDWVAGGATATPYVLLGDGTGNFTSTSAGLPTAKGGLLERSSFGMLSNLLADLNGDNKPDLVLGSEGDPNQKIHNALIFWNTGTGFSSKSVTYLPKEVFGNDCVVHDIATMDLDGDGDQDLVMLTSEFLPTYADGWALEVYRNDNGKFILDTSSRFAAGDNGEGKVNENSGIGAADHIYQLDVNGDGVKDIVVTEIMNNLPSSNAPMVWINDGFGHFEVALRAGDLDTLTGNPYFVGSYSAPIETSSGVSFYSFSSYQGTLYQTIVQAKKLLPLPTTITGTDNADLIKTNANDNIINGGAGSDTVIFSGNSSNYTITQVSGGYKVVDNVGIDGADTISKVEHFQFSDKTLSFITPIEGGSGNDKLTGTADSEQIYGYAGADILAAGAGNDTISGGDGKDKLTGGDGNDIFVFDTVLNPKNNLDTITDFASGTDSIQLDKSIFTAYAVAESDLAADFVSGIKVKALDATDHFLYDTKSGALYYDADGSGSGKTIQFATLTGHPTLSAGDLYIV